MGSDKRDLGPMIGLPPLPRCVWAIPRDDIKYKFRFSGWKRFEDGQPPYASFDYFIPLEDSMSLSTFFHKVGSAFKKLFGSSTWEKTASSTITFVAPLLETIVGYVAGSGAENTVKGIIGTVQSDLATIAAVVDGGQVDAHGTAVVVSALNSVRANMSGLLNLAEVKNSDKQAAITTAVNLVVGEVDAMLGALPAAQAVNTVAPAPPAPQQ